MSKLGEKDAFPTLPTKNPDAPDYVCYGGPGLSVREHVAIQIATGMMAAPGVATLMAERSISLLAVRQADDLLKVLQEYDEGEVPETEDDI